MLIVNSDALRNFLNLHLSKLCGADCGALTKYILALLKKNRQPAELKDFLVDQLDVFLLKKTSSFVEMLLEALKTKSYIENVSDSNVSKKDDSSAKNGVPDMLKKQTSDSNSKQLKEENNLVDNTTQDASVEQENSRKKTNVLMKPQSDSLSTLSEASSTSRSASEHGEKVDIVDSPAKTFDLETVDNSINADYRPLKSVASNYIKRCADYDQRGYCLMGSNCLFAHGFDAIPLNMEDVPSLNLNSKVLSSFEEETSLATKTTSCSPLPPLPPTTSPPPLPPLPPPSMMDTGLGVLEPYNPESPGMTAAYYATPLCMGPVLPPPGICHNMYGMRSNETFAHTSHTKPQRRTRELIGVPTVNFVSREFDNENFSVKEKTLTSHTELKRKGTFDFRRLGPPSKLAKTDSVLELRNVPSHLNNIDALNQHFSQFGRIINLQISCDNDPEAALVKFASPVQALNAYRASVGAIFNNRFIKVFYHRSNGTNPLTIEKTESTQANSSDLKDMIFEKVPQHTPPKYASSHISKGNLSHNRTVYQKFPENKLKGEKMDTKKYLPFERELELLRKKNEFMTESLDHQKDLLAKLMKAKSKKEADFLKKTIGVLASNMEKVKSEIKNDSEELKKKLVNKHTQIVNKSEKDLLDAEMDLYIKNNKEKRAEKQNTILSEVKDLKEKQFGNVENNEDKNAFNLATFSSRADDINPAVGDDEEEEEDDEDSEARSWRR